MKKQRHASVGGGKARHGERSRVVRLAQAGKSFGRREVLIAAALAVATLAVYGQVISHQFISLDDDVYIRDNPMVAGGLTLQGIAWAFTTFHDSNWHPITWLSHMVDSEIFGLNAGGPLVVNALIHVSNTLLLFLFLNRVTGASWRSAIVAALFALHPLHVESVAWVVERKDTLSTLFGLLSLLAYARYAEAASAKRYALVALWLGLGLMAKPMLVTWPFVLLLLDYWPLGRLEWQPADGIKRFAKAWVPLVREKLPLFCLVAASMVVTYLADSYGGTGGTVRALVDAPVSLRLSNALASYGKYLLLTVWPSGLGVYYPLSPAGVPVWQLTASIVLLLAMTAMTLQEARKRPYLIMGWLWFLGTLVPVIGLVRVGVGSALADRYHYIPSIGLFIAIIFGLADLASAWRIGRVSIAVVSTAVLLLFGSLTALQISRWRDTITLFERTLSVTSDNLVIHYNFGHFLGQQGRYEEAVPHFVEALRIKPDFFDALINMGVSLLAQGKPAEAISYYQRALSVEPDNANAHMQLALALVKEDKGDDALQQFYKALELAPKDADIRANLGLMLARRDKLSEAAAQLNEALRLNPNSAEAHNNLGLVLLMAGQPEASLAHFSMALNLKPNFAVAQDNLMRAQRQIDARQK
jgi:Tfp pilus assembly protein PilF